MNDGGESKNEVTDRKLEVLSAKAKSRIGLCNTRINPRIREVAPVTAEMRRYNQHIPVFCESSWIRFSRYRSNTGETALLGGRDDDQHDPNVSCLFATGSPTDTVGSQNIRTLSTGSSTDTVGSQNIRTLSTRQFSFLVAERPMPLVLLRLFASVCRRYRSWPHWQWNRYGLRRLKHHILAIDKTSYQRQQQHHQYHEGVTVFLRKLLWRVQRSEDQSTAGLWRSEWRETHHHYYHPVLCTSQWQWRTEQKCTLWTAVCRVRQHT